MSLSRPTMLDAEGTQGWLNELYRYLAIHVTGSPLADPGADRIYFWDDSSGYVDWLTVGTGLSISGTTLSSTVSASYVLLDTKTASNSATLDFTTGLSSTYETYMFDLVDIVPATDDVGLWIRVSLDGGSTWKSGASDYGWASTVNTGSSTDFRDLADSEIEIVPSGLSANNAIGNSTGEGFSGMIRFQNPASTAIFKHFASIGSAYVSANGETVPVLAAAGRYIIDQSAINGVQFLMESGNITSGKIRLYGLTKS